MIYKKLGEMLHTTVTGYIAQTEVEARLSATSSRVFYHGLPSISFTHTYLVRNNLFGIVKSVSMSDLIMDVQARNVMLALDGDREKTKLYAQQNGVMGSYYEGHIWKQMFPDDPGINPVSTVHLFAQAAIQGQPFVVIDRSNMNEALANITGLGDDTRTDIVNAVFAGNTVTTHSMPINMGDWRGFGYVVFDPRTGSGAYMIDGGSNGGGSGCGGCDKCYASSFSHYYHYAGGSSFVESCKEFFKDAAKWIYDVAIPFLLIKLNWIISAILSILQSLPIIKCILDKSDMTDSQKTWAIIWLILGIIGLIVFGLLGGWLSVFAVILGIIYVKSFKDKYCLVPNDAVRVKRYKLAYKT